MTGKEYSMLFALNAQMSNSFSSTFTGAQKQIADMQNELAELQRRQADISAYEKQQGAVESTQRKLEALKAEYDNIQKEIGETEGFSSSLENALLRKQQQIDKTNNSLETQTQKLDKMNTALKDAGIDTNNLAGESTRLKEKQEELRAKQEEVAESSQKMGKAGTEAVTGIYHALVAAGLVKLFKEISGAVIDLANDYSRSQSEIAKATGATGAELEAMRRSAVGIHGDMVNSLADVSSVMGVLSTATGLQGNALDQLTRQTLTYARVNNEDAGASAKQLGRLMNALSADARELSGVMDMMTLSSQMSGLGVNELTQYIIQAGPSFVEMGFSVERQIALFSQFYKAGAEPRELVSSLNKVLTTMAREGATDAETAFTMLLNQIKAAPNILSATKIAADAFGARMGGKIAEDIRAGRFEIEEWVGVLEQSQGTVEKTAEAAGTLEEKWLKASNSIKSAFMQELSPAVEEASAYFAGLISDLGQFLQQNPALVKAISAFVGVIGGAVAVLGAATVAAKLATVAFAAMSAAIPGLNIIMGIVAGVGALTAGIVALREATKGSSENVRALSAASREQYYELERLQREYDNVCNTMGATSAEAQLLKRELDEATRAYEDSRMTAKELAKAQKELAESYNELRAAQADAISEAGKEGESILNLANKLEKLIAIENKSEAEKQKILAIVDMLNQAIPDLGLAYDQYSDSLSKSVDGVLDLARAELDRIKNQASYEAMLDLMREEEAIQENLRIATLNREAAERELTAAQEAQARKRAELLEKNKNRSGWSVETDRNMALYNRDVVAAGTALNELIKAEQEAQRIYDINADAINGYAEGIADYNSQLQSLTAEQQEAIAAQIEMERALEGYNVYISDVTDRMDALAEAYEKSYEAALKSVQGQYKLWDDAADIVAMSTDKMNASIESQLAYWQDYNKDLAQLGERASDIEGLREMLASFSDGSKESVNAVAGMAKANDAELERMVKNWQELQAEQDLVAAQLAELETDFTNTMDSLVEEVNSALQEMSLPDEATKAAQETIGAYIREAESSVGRVQNAYTMLGLAAQYGLVGNSGHTRFNNIFSYRPDGSHAGGLDYVPYDGYMAELHRGERVLTAKEAVAANTDNSVQYIISLAPQYYNTGGNTDDMNSAMSENNESLRDLVEETLRDIHSDSLRGRY